MLIYILSRSVELYSTKRIFQAATNSHHNVRVINYLECDLIIEDGQYKIIYEHEELIKPDYVIPRIGASVTSYGCSVVRHFEVMGAKVLNPSAGIHDSRDKYRCLQLLTEYGVKVPNTYFSYDLYYAERVVKTKLGYPFIYKVIEGTHGEGVHLVDSAEQMHNLFYENQAKDQKVLLQEFISEFQGKDLRVIVIGNEVVASMMRVAQAGDFRSNIHRGGRGENVPLSEKEKEVALKAARVLGLGMAGVDILRSSRGPLIIEVNSSPGIEGIEGVTKIKIAEKLIEFIEKSEE
ncbi:MAG: ribosomal protein S6--L-glutamate ligase [Arenicella sp.]|jgi:ribosomal protein S6--L-glutamate ligase